MLNDPDDAEQVEKVRQAIMRARELLDVLASRTSMAERRYDTLFAAIPPEKRAALEEKALQREAALLALNDLEPLRRFLWSTHFELLDIVRAFEETHDRLAE